MKTKYLQFAQLTESASAIASQAAELKSPAPELITFRCGWFDGHWGTYWHVHAKKLLLTPAFAWNNGVVELLGHHYWSYDERFVVELQRPGLALGGICAGK